MAGYYRTAVVEIIIMVGLSMTAWKDTLNCRVNQTGLQETWRTLLYGRTSAGNTVHVCVKHSVIHTYIQK